MIHQPEVVDIDKVPDINSSMDRKQEQRGDKDAVVEDKLKRTHCNEGICSGRMVPA